jgi:hypothetical protein
MVWLGIAALGAFHGLNPAMGWLFAVALGQQEGRAAAVLRALPPIAAGHLLSIAAVVAAARAADELVPAAWLRPGGAAALVVFALWLLLSRSAHPRWVGMQLRAADLLLWSLLMTTAHGAGLMLLPAVLVADPAAAAGAHAYHAGREALPPLLVLTIHTAAMLFAMGAAALAAHRLLGLGFLRRRWINVELVWIAALLISACVLALT